MGINEFSGTPTTKTYPSLSIDKNGYLWIREPGSGAATLEQDTDIEFKDIASGVAFINIRGDAFFKTLLLGNPRVSSSATVAQMPTTGAPAGADFNWVVDCFRLGIGWLVSGIVEAA
ncbi:hypothetical protein DF196_11815 [Bifidobacterium callitrichidarum]|uniref:Uncharacterized protein n=1 Tax=Bifidobacterium callitrichidarum TaxID=2052941 RepID=A0A2U2N0N7_9BIFI|nr:hypothetical protein DF196_11815 [Bifidobacterium callitrichidarum]